MTESFNPNDHTSKNRFTVYIMRLRERYNVTSIYILSHSENQPHIWGFADDGSGGVIEWDITWGDVLRQHPITTEEEA